MAKQEYYNCIQSLNADKIRAQDSILVLQLKFLKRILKIDTKEPGESGMSCARFL